MAAIETWDGPDGEAWPPPWTITNGGATIQGGRGDLNRPSSNTATGAVHNTVVADVDWTVTFSLASYGGDVAGSGRDSNIWFAARASVEPLSATARDVPLQGYAVRFFISPEINPGEAWYVLELHRFDGSGTDPGRAPGAGTGTFDRAVLPGVDYRLRMRVIGNRVQLRYWAATEAEPTGWSVDWTDPGTPLPAGRVWLGTFTGSNGLNRGFRYDNLTITAPPTVNAGPDQSVRPGQLVTLAAAAAAEDGVPLVTWAQTGGPAVALGGGGVNRTFTAPLTLAGATLAFTATAADRAGALPASDSVTVTVAPAPARIWDGTAEIPALLRVMS